MGVGVGCEEAWGSKGVAIVTLGDEEDTMTGEWAVGCVGCVGSWGAPSGLCVAGLFGRRFLRDLPEFARAVPSSCWLFVFFNGDEVAWTGSTSEHTRAHTLHRGEDIPAITPNRYSRTSELILAEG